MKNARRLVLLGVASVLTMAFVASSASAITVRTEPGGVACTAVSAYTLHGAGTGGCLISMVSTTTMVMTTPFFTITCPTSDFEGRIGANGEGYVYNAHFINCNASLAPCAENGQFTNWRAEMATGVEVFNGPQGPFTTAENRFEWHYCIVGLGFTTFRCHIAFTLVENPTHRYAMTTGGVAQPCESPNQSNGLNGAFANVVNAAHLAFEVGDV